MLTELQGSSVLERTSSFVLEVLPYLLSALILAVVVPGFLYSRANEAKAAIAANGSRLEIIHWNYAVLSPDFEKTVRDKLAYR